MADAPGTSCSTQGTQLPTKEAVIWRVYQRASIAMEIDSTGGSDSSWSESGAPHGMHLDVCLTPRYRATQRDDTVHSVNACSIGIHKRHFEL